MSSQTSRWPTWQKVISFVPVLNFLYFISENDSNIDIVSPDGAAAMIGTMGTLAALLISVSASALMAVDFDELSQADERCKCAITV